MALKKRNAIVRALSSIGVHGYEFDVSPEEDEELLQVLDGMMAQWDGLGIKLGYPIPSDTDESDLDQDLGIPLSAYQTVYLNLGILAAPGYGKAVAPETKKAAADGYSVLLIAAATPRRQELPDTLPRGAGNRTPWGLNRRFFPVPQKPPTSLDQGGDLELASE